MSRATESGSTPLAAAVRREVHSLLRAGSLTADAAALAVWPKLSAAERGERGRPGVEYKSLVKAAIEEGIERMRAQKQSAVVHAHTAEETNAVAADDSSEPPKRKRGRPPKVKRAEVVEDVAVEEEAAEEVGQAATEPVKRKRGRPPKPKPAEVTAEETSAVEVDGADVEREPEREDEGEDDPEQRKRGRPPRPKRETAVVAVEPTEDEQAKEEQAHTEKRQRYTGTSVEPVCKGSWVRVAVMCAPQTPPTLPFERVCVTCALCHMCPVSHVPCVTSVLCHICPASHLPTCRVCASLECCPSLVSLTACACDHTNLTGVYTSPRSFFVRFRRRKRKYPNGREAAPRRRGLRKKRAVSPICGARRHSVFSHMSADEFSFTGSSSTEKKRSVSPICGARRHSIFSHVSSG